MEKEQIIVLISSIILQVQARENMIYILNIFHKHLKMTETWPFPKGNNIYLG